jgi:hypothetical protein
VTRSWAAVRVGAFGDVPAPVPHPALPGDLVRSGTVVDQGRGVAAQQAADAVVAVAAGCLRIDRLIGPGGTNAGTLRAPGQDLPGGMQPRALA